MVTKHATLTRLLRILGRGFIEDRCVRVASSLTFTTLLALVPVVTVLLTVASAFPVFRSLLEQLHNFVVQNMLPRSADAVTAYAQQFSENAANLTAIGVVILGVTALLLLFTIETEFNVIWRVSRPRPFLRRVLVYSTVLVLGPLLIGASLSLTSYLISLSFGLVAEVPGARLALLRFLPLMLTSAAFALLYFTVPRCPVMKRDALAGGIAAGAGFEVMKHGFGFYVTQFPTYTVVYGAFAAVPIFLLWIYLSWLVILGGAVLVAVIPEWRGRAGPRRPARRRSDGD